MKPNLQTFLVGLLLLFAQAAVAQTTADSLLKVAMDLPTPLAQKEYLFEQSGNYINGPFVIDSVIWHVMRLSQEVDGIDEQAGLAAVYSGYFERSFRISEAEKLLLPYFEQRQKIESALELGNVYYRMAVIRQRQNRAGEAMALAEQGIQAYEKLDYMPTIVYGDAVVLLAKTQIELSRFGEASENLNKSINIFNAQEDSLGVAGSILELSILFSQIGLYDEAAAYLEKRREISPNFSGFQEAQEAIMRSRNLVLQKKYDQAIRKAEEGAAIDGIKEHASYYLVYFFNTIIEAEYFSGNTTGVLDTYKKLKPLAEEYKASDDLSQLLLQSKFLYSLSTKDYPKAEIDGQQLFANAEKSNDGAEIEMHARFLAELYKQTNQPEEALKYTELYTAKRDSIQTANKTNALLLYQTQFETQQKENEIDQLAADKELEETKAKQYAIVSLALGGILLIGGGLLFLLLKARKKLRAQNGELVELNKTKDRFFGIIAHDLRSPIVALSGVDEQMEYHLEKQNIEKLKKVSKLVGKTAKNLNGLLDSLLNWALVQTGQIPYKPEKLNVKAAAAEIAALFAGNAQAKEIEIDNLVGEEATVFADSNAINTILRNLLSNALKFTPKGGKIEIGAHQKSGKTMVFVKDNGTGMSSQQVQSIFELNKKSKDGTAGEKGTGLGLRLCKDLATLNKGDITVSSQPDQGSTFAVSLPQGK